MAPQVRPGDPAEKPTTRPFEEAAADVADSDRNYAVDAERYPVSQLDQADVDRALEGAAPPEAPAGEGPLEPGGRPPAGTEAADELRDAELEAPTGEQPPEGLKGAALTAWKRKHQPEG